MKRYIIGALIGILGGFVGAMFGLSGAFVIIPLLILFNICSSHVTAQGTTLCMLLPPISIFAAYTYYKNKKVDIPIAILLSLFYIVGTLIGSNKAVKLEEKTAKIYFSIMLIFLSMYLLYDALYSKTSGSLN
jgi:uncharacterized membrane protein YfcA